MSITQDRLKSLLLYEPITGKFTWKVNKGSKKAGAQAGNLHLDNHIRIRIDGKIYRAHRLAWLYTYGRWPSQQIDHINHDRSDNRLVNLREVDQITNHQNLGIRKDNKSGSTGVHWDRRMEKWMAFIHVNKVRKHIGYFDILQDAILARKNAEIRYGFHPNHGKHFAQKKQ